MSAVPPLMLKTEANPEGLPIEVFDDLRAGVAADRSQFFKDLTGPFYGANWPGANVSQRASGTPSGSRVSRPVSRAFSIASRPSRRLTSLRI